MTVRNHAPDGVGPARSTDRPPLSGTTRPPRTFTCRSRRRLPALIAALLSITLLYPPSGATAAGAQERFDRWIAGPVSVLMLPDELDLLPRISGAGMEEAFVQWFWHRRDPDPSTSINEFRRDFEDRLAFVDKEFAEPGRPGWVTPRGQLYLLLGPPRRRGVTLPVYAVDGHLTALTVWEYEPPRARGRSVLFYFVETRQGVRLASLEGNRRLSSEQVECLRDARAELVVDAAPFAQVVDRRQQPLPGHARFVRAGDGVLAVVSLPLRELLGEPTEGAIRYRVAIAARTAGGLDVQEDRYLGTLTFSLPASMFRRWADTDLEVAVWTPSEAAAYSVTELPTGRTLTVSPGEQPPAGVAGDGAQGARLAIGHHLATTALMGDHGVAVAYLPANEPNTPATAYVVQATAAESEPLPGGALALLPVHGPPRR